MIFNDPDAGPPKELTQLLGVYQEVKGFIKKRLAFLVERHKKINGAFSIISRRNLRGPDLVCIYANFCDKKMLF